MYSIHCIQISSICCLELLKYSLLVYLNRYNNKKILKYMNVVKNVQKAECVQDALLIDVT